MKRISIVLLVLFSVLYYGAQGQNTLPTPSKSQTKSNASQKSNAPRKSETKKDANAEEANNQTASLKDLEDYVYFVRLTSISVTAEPGTEAGYYISELTDGGKTWTYPFKESESVIGSGFITSDGFFVTARHVIEPWAYIEFCNLGDPLFWVAFLSYEGMGGTVEATYHIECKTGDRRDLYFREFTVSRHRDEEVVLTATDDDPYHVRRAMAKNDYAYVKLPVKSNIVVDRVLSNNIPSGTRLDILGFPEGMGSDKNNIKPQYTYATTSNTGLYHGQIPVTGAQMEPGTSGGPVFCEKDGQYFVVGIVSRGMGKHSGVIVPMSQVNY